MSDHFATLKSKGLSYLSNFFQCVKINTTEASTGVFCKKCTLKKIRKIHRKTPAQWSYKPRKRLWHRCFSVSFAKFFKSTFLQNTQGNLSDTTVSSWTEVIKMYLKDLHLDQFCSIFIFFFFYWMVLIFETLLTILQHMSVMLT